MKMPRKDNFLDTDVNGLEQNLKFVRNDFENDLQQIFDGDSNANVALLTPPLDYKTVVPKPGFCIKSFKVNNNEKYFVNVCQTDEIPAPEDITEEELSQILESDLPSSYRIPMSISEPRIVKDKSNNSVDACDIAVNPRFFVKCVKSILFKDFFMTLIGEALNEKYNVQIRIDNAIILNNRKFIGTIVTHRIRKKDVKTVLKSYKNPSKVDIEALKILDKSSQKCLIQEIDLNEVNRIKQKAMFPLRTAGFIPKYKLRAKLNKEKVDEILAEFYLPKCICSKDIILDVGEDRILLDVPKCGYSFDKFVSYNLKQELTRAVFNKANRMLQVYFKVDPQH